MDGRDPARARGESACRAKAGRRGAPPTPSRRRLFRDRGEPRRGHRRRASSLLVAAPRAVDRARGHRRTSLHETGRDGTRRRRLRPRRSPRCWIPTACGSVPGVGDVTFAARCVFDGHVVPHLVVRTPDGPVTVLMLAAPHDREAVPHRRAGLRRASCCRRRKAASRRRAGRRRPRRRRAEGLRRGGLGRAEACAHPFIHSPGEQRDARAARAVLGEHRRAAPAGAGAGPARTARAD